MVQFLSLDDVLESHAEQIAAYGGSDGIRDVGLLESALAQPAAMFGGQYLHVDVFGMAAAYLFHIVKNHPFLDGNKRVGLEAALLFLEINGLSIETTDEARPTRDSDRRGPNHKAANCEILSQARCLTSGPFPAGPLPIFGLGNDMRSINYFAGLVRPTPTET